MQLDRPGYQVVRPIRERQGILDTLEIRERLDQLGPRVKLERLELSARRAGLDRLVRLEPREKLARRVPSVLRAGPVRLAQQAKLERRELSAPLVGLGRLDLRVRQAKLG